MAYSVWAHGLTGVDVWLNCKRGSKGTGRSGSRGRYKSGCKGGFVVRYPSCHGANYGT